MPGAQFFTRWGEWLRFALTVAAIAAFALMDNRYVSVNTYTRDRENSQAANVNVTSSLQTIQTSIALLQRQTDLLSNHESRIRSNELAIERLKQKNGMVSLSADFASN